jgi:tetratricopeptide (TPR) repeat protein
VAASKELGNVLDDAPIIFRARAMTSLGAIHLRANRVEEAWKLYVEAQRINSTAHDLLLSAFIPMNMAQVYAIEENHRESLRILESIHPFMLILAKSYPNQYCSYLNSLANELIWAGRIEEAKYASNLALASPYADRYPEFRETYIDIASRRTGNSIRSQMPVGIELRLSNVFSLAEAREKRSVADGKAIGPMPMEMLAGWAMKTKEKPRKDEEPDENLATLEERLEINTWASDPNTTPDAIKQTVNFIRKLRDRESEQK